MTGEAIGILAESIYKKSPGELTEQEKENISAWATLASGLAGGLVGGDTQSAANSAQAGKTTVENNSLGYQFAQLSMELERCKDDSCRQKVKQKQEELYQSSKENGKVIASVGVDLTPVAGDFKSFAEAEDWIDYTLAAAGMLPGAKFITKPLKEAKLLLKAGDLNGANKLIKEASDGISARTPTGSKGNPLNIIDGSNKPTIINNRNYSSHSLDRMQRQGITPIAVENTIRPENAVVGKRPGTTAYYDKDNHITVITDTKTDTVITVDYGKIKQ